MNQKSLNAKSKAHKQILDHLKNKKIFKIFKKFENSISVNSNFAVAISGGPDSLSLAFLSRCFSLKNKLNLKCFIVDHGLRKESSVEAKTVVKILKKISLSCKIIKWNGKKPFTNIQSKARIKRYSLLIRECKKNNIKHILLGHHLDDLFENFLIRILRGSGLNGLVSFDKETKYKDNHTKILRPLLDLEKKDLIYLSDKVFGFFVQDPSNKDENFKRIRVRNLLKSLEKEGLDKKKFLLTINNLKDSDKSIKFYVDKNIKENTSYLNKRSIILNQYFFSQSHEVIFRSLTKIIQTVGKKYYPVRGKNVDELIKKIRSNSLSKVTLGNCYVKILNQSVIISKET
jgi:tRNA(Ile)-lysidine synthase